MTTETGATTEPTAPRARFRPRITVQAMLALVAVAALALFLYGEFKNGLPPRFVYRGMLARMVRLKPGMTRTEALAILGMDRDWYLGGSGPTAARYGGGGIYVTQDYHEVTEGIPTGRLSDNSQLPSTVSLLFAKRPGDAAYEGGPGLLQQAAFCDRLGVVTMMPEPGRGSIRAGGGAR